VHLSHRLAGVFIAILTLALGCGGCSAPKPAVPSPTAEKQGAPVRAMITQVTTEPLAGAVRIAVETSEVVEYTAFTLPEPPRLVFTFPEATLGDIPRPIPVTGVIRSIEPLLVPEENAVRLVVSLRHMTTHTVEIQGRRCLITLADSGTRTADLVPQAPSVPTPGATITAITVEALPDHSVVALQTAGPPPKVQVKQQRDPIRLVLDIKPAHLSPAQEKTLVLRDPEGVVTHLETVSGTDGQEAAVKVLVHLRTAVPFAVHQENDVIRLALTRSSSTTAAKAPRAPDSPRASALGPPASRPPLPATSPAPATGPRMISQVAPVGKGATPSAPPNGAASGPATPRQDLPPAGELAAPSGFTGEKISLDFQDAEINDILRLIAEVGGVNIIAGGDVKGTVTTRMMDVPWDQALDVILKINGLAQERTGNIIRVAPLGKFTQERSERVQAQETEVRAEPLTTRVLPVNYATAKDLQPNLAKLLSNRGTILIDARTNTMIITDTQKHLDEVLALTAKLDRPTPQVMIEARIVESSRNFLRELGIQLGVAHSQITDRAFPNRIDIRGGLPNAGLSGGLATPAPANFLLDLPAAVTTGSGGAIGFSLASIGGSILDAQLSALESSGRGKIISSPKIATLDNTEAQIQSGRRIPVQTTSAEGTRTEFVDASTTLKVTPHVTPNDYIAMKITATKNEPDFGNAVNGIPTITTREATTDMLVKDGDTVVIGGLYRRTIQSSRTGVPGLSSIPVIGWLFRRDRANDESDELLIFLTPRIIRDDTLGRNRAALSY